MPKSDDSMFGVPPGLGAMSEEPQPYSNIQPISVPIHVSAPIPAYGPICDQEIIQSKALLSPDQYIACHMAEYLMKAVLSGSNSQIVKNRVRELIRDTNIQMIVSEELQVSLDRMKELLQ